MPRCVGSPSAGVSAGKTSSFLFTPRCWSTCTTPRLSWALPPGKVIKGWALRLAALEAVKIPFMLWAGGTLAQSSALDPAAGTPIWYLVPSGNAHRIASLPSYWSWPRYQHWTLSFPYLVFPSILDAFTSSKFLSCGFPGGSVVKNPPQYRTHRRHGFNPWVGKIPWRREWQPIAVFLTGESHGLKSLEGYCPWGHKE